MMGMPPGMQQGFLTPGPMFGMMGPQMQPGPFGMRPSVAAPLPKPVGTCCMLKLVQLHWCLPGMSSPRVLSRQKHAQQPKLCKVIKCSPATWALGCLGPPLIPSR